MFTEELASEGWDGHSEGWDDCSSEDEITSPEKRIRGKQPKRPSTRKPTEAFKASLRFIRRRDYESLIRITIEALIEDYESHVLIAMPYHIDFPDSFPKKFIQSNVGDINTYSVRAWRLLEWLNQNGYTTVTAGQIGEMKKKITRQVSEIDNLFDLF